MNNKVFIGLVVVAAGVLTGWFVWRGNPLQKNSVSEPTPTPAYTGSQLPPPGSAEAAGGNGVEKGGVAARVVVTLTDKGFAPSPLTVKVGTTVTFVNESTGPMWVASNPHPSHTGLPGFDELTAVDSAGTYEYTFAKTGTFGYHNHMDPSIGGSVVVMQ